jgi:hypothetical protein
MSEEKNAEELLAAAKTYADMAMTHFFDTCELDEDAIEKLDHDLRAWFLFPNVPPEDRAALARLGYAGHRLSESESLDSTKVDVARRKRSDEDKIRWQELKDDVVYSGVLDSLTPLQREILQQGYLIVSDLS